MLRITKTLLLPMGLALAITSHPIDADPALAQGCRNNGSTQQLPGAKLTVGSQVDGDLVTVCANRKLLQAVTKTISPKPQPAKSPPKNTSKPAPSKAPKPVLKPAPKPVAKPAPKPVTKPAPKPSVRTKTRTQQNAATAVFKALKPNAWLSPGHVFKPNQVANFEVEFKDRFGSARLFGKPVVLRFRPLSAAWDFGDSQTADSPKTTHSFAALGEYSVFARVEYRIDYRLASGEWLRDPDTITLAALPLVVTVANQLPPQSSGSTVLITPP